MKIRSRHWLCFNPFSARPLGESAGMQQYEPSHVIEASDLILSPKVECHARSLARLLLLLSPMSPVIITQGIHIFYAIFSLSAAGRASHARAHSVMCAFCVYIGALIPASQKTTHTEHSIAVYVFVAHPLFSASFVCQLLASRRPPFVGSTINSAHFYGFSVVHLVLVWWTVCIFSFCPWSLCISSNAMCVCVCLSGHIPFSFCLLFICLFDCGRIVFVQLRASVSILGPIQLDAWLVFLWTSSVASLPALLLSKVKCSELWPRYH